jgi:hypothetical protein
MVSPQRVDVASAASMSLRDHSRFSFNDGKDELASTPSSIHFYSLIVVLCSMYNNSAWKYPTPWDDLDSGFAM